jgi:membrane fusion protein (multidrug efflux system)
MLPPPHSLRSAVALRWAVLSGLLAVGLLLGACSDQSPEASIEPPPGVLVAKVRNREISDTIKFVGRVEALNDVSLRAQVEGYLLERRFEEGESVELGRELFIIDPVIYQANVAAAEGEVAQVEAALARAQKDLARYRELRQSQSIPEQQVDQAESDRLMAEANLKSAKAKLMKAHIDLSHTVIKAPFAGRLGSSRVSVGDLVTPQSEELARIVQLDPIHASFNVSERDIIRSKRKLGGAGDGADDISKVEVRLRLPDGSEYEEVGILDFVDNVVDHNTGTILVRARFANPKGILVPGLYVSTILGRKEMTSKRTIPQAAVQEDQTGSFVLLVGPDKRVERRKIETGKAFDGEIVVRSGLEPDERVIVEGIQKVRPGQEVNTKEALRASLRAEAPEER